MAIADRIGPTYEVHYSYLVSLSERESSNSFKFDGFYALQVTDLFASTLSEWVKTPEVVVAAHQVADLKLAESNARDLGKLISSDNPASQLVTVVVRHADSQRARAIADGLREVMRKNIDEYHDQGIPAIKFRVVETDPWVGVVKPEKGVVGIATLLFSFFFLVNILLLWESLKGVE